MKRLALAIFAIFACSLAGCAPVLFTGYATEGFRADFKGENDGSYSGCEVWGTCGGVSSCDLYGNC